MLSPGDDRPKIDLVSLAGISRAPPQGFRARCPRCRYDLAGLPDSKCPECGLPFTLRGLIADWELRRDRPRGDVDLVVCMVLALAGSLPADLGDAGQALWKVPLVVLMWGLACVWAARHKREIEQEGHRLLWFWIPCTSTALGLSATPTLNVVVALVMAVVAIACTLIAWRRSPVSTAVIATATLSLPVAVGLFMGIGLLLSALAGKSRGYYWSPADYPGWYWRNVRGVRGVNNRDAVRLASILIAIAGAAALALIPMWVRLGARWLSGRRAKPVRRR